MVVLWFSLLLDFHLMYVHIILSSVKEAELLPLRKELLTRLTQCSHCNNSCFEDSCLVLIGPVPFLLLTGYF